MIHLSGAFGFQRPGPVDDRLETFEFLPAAVYIAMTLLNDDGTPAFVSKDLGDDLPDISARVVLSRPQIAEEGVPLDLEPDIVDASGGFVAAQAVIDLEGRNLPTGWLPLAILIFLGNSAVGVITAAPEPIAVGGIAPPVTEGARP